MMTFQLPQPFRDELLRYFGARPYAEAAPAVAALQSLELASTSGDSRWEHVCRNMLTPEDFDRIKAAVSKP